MESLTSFPVKAPRYCLSIDTGRRSGYAITDHTGKVWHEGVFEVYKTGKKKCSEGEALCGFYKFLSEIRLNFAVDHVSFERISGGAKGAQIGWSNQYRAMLTYFCEVRQLPLVPFSPPTIKKAVTGTGKADKHEMMRVLRERGYAPWDDNHADAIGCGLTFWQAYKEREKDAAKTNRGVRKSARRKVDSGEPSEAKGLPSAKPRRSSKKNARRDGPPVSKPAKRKRAAAPTVVRQKPKRGAPTSRDTVREKPARRGRVDKPVARARSKGPGSS